MRRGWYKGILSIPLWCAQGNEVAPSTEGEQSLSGYVAYQKYTAMVENSIVSFLRSEEIIAPDADGSVLYATIRQVLTVPARLASLLVLNQTAGTGDRSGCEEQALLRRTGGCMPSRAHSRSLI